MPTTNNHKNYKSLKVKIYKLEQLVMKLSKQPTSKAKCFLKDWVGWWAKKLKRKGK